MVKDASNFSAASPIYERISRRGAQPGRIARARLSGPPRPNAPCPEAKALRAAVPALRRNPDRKEGAF